MLRIRCCGLVAVIWLGGCCRVCWVGFGVGGRYDCDCWLVVWGVVGFGWYCLGVFDWCGVGII